VTFNDKIVLIVCSIAIVGQHRNRQALEQVKCSANAKTAYDDFLKSLQKSGFCFENQEENLTSCVFIESCVTARTVLKLRVNNAVEEVAGLCVHFVINILF
jgi:hypothetical protein